MTQQWSWVFISSSTARRLWEPNIWVLSTLIELNGSETDSVKGKKTELAAHTRSCCAGLTTATQ